MRGIMVRPFVINHNCALAGSGENLTLDRVMNRINGNTGNSIITHAVARHTPLDCPHDGLANIFTDDLTPEDVERINSTYTHVFVMFQDHLGPDRNGIDWGRLTRMIEPLRLPIVVFSLGVCGAADGVPAQLAADMSAEAKYFFKLLSERAVSIGVRGEMTVATLDAMGIRNYAMVGCPSAYEAGAARLVQMPHPDQVAFVAGLGLYSTRHHAEQTFFVLQSEEDLIDMVYRPGDAPPHDTTILRSSYAGYGETMMLAMALGRARMFTNPADWKQFMRQYCGLAAGTRVHGATMALNAGKPALVVAGDIRAAEMCALMAVPHLPGHCLLEMTIAQMLDAIDVEAINATYQHRYWAYVGWLSELGLYTDHGDRNPADDWPWITLAPHHAHVLRTRLMAQLRHA